MQSPYSNGEGCTVPTTNKKFVNCREKDKADSSKCKLCNSGYVRTQDGDCKEGSCDDTCLYCTEDLCLVCKEGFIQNEPSNKCVSLVTQSYRIPSCKHHIIPKDSADFIKCHECEANYYSFCKSYINGICQNWPSYTYVCSSTGEKTDCDCKDNLDKDSCIVEPSKLMTNRNCEE